MSILLLIIICLEDMFNINIFNIFAPANKLYINKPFRRRGLSNPLAMLPKTDPTRYYLDSFQTKYFAYFTVLRSAIKY